MFLIPKRVGRGVLHPHIFAAYYFSLSFSKLHGYCYVLRIILDIIIDPLVIVS